MYFKGHNDNSELVPMSQMPHSLPKQRYELVNKYSKHEPLEVMAESSHDK